MTLLYVTGHNDISETDLADTYRKAAAALLPLLLLQILPHLARKGARRGQLVVVSICRRHSSRSLDKTDALVFLHAHF